MTSLTGCSGGGWTLVMKTDGRKVWNKSDIKACSSNGSSRDAKLFSLTAYSYVEMKSFFSVKRLWIDNGVYEKKLCLTLLNIKARCCGQNWKQYKSTTFRTSTIKMLDLNA